MLVLSRQRDETVMIGEEIAVTVVDIRGDKVRLGIGVPRRIDAPLHVNSVMRKEVLDASRRENREAAEAGQEDQSGPATSKTPGPTGLLVLARQLDETIM